jgi:hypothetical protein
MNKYKVEFTTTQKHVIDVQAINEQEARELVITYYNQKVDTDTLHYYEYGDEETEISTVFDVTNTDDPFNPENDITNNN